MSQNSFSILITFFSPLIHLTILALFLLPKTSLCVDPQFQACVPETCGDDQIISFPFWIEGRQKSYCGYPRFNLSCNNDGHPILNISRNNYIIQNIFYKNQSLRVTNAGFLDRSISNTCFPPIQNLTLVGNRFDISPNNTDIYFYSNCSSSIPKNLTSYKVTCSADNGTSSVLAMFGQDRNLGYASKNCNSVVAAPVEVYGDESINGIGRDWEYYKEVLTRGFVLKWIASNCSVCEKSGGRCGFDEETYHFRCFCPDRPHAWHCRATRKKKLGLMLATGASVAGIGVLMFIVCCFRRKFSSNKFMVFWKKETQNHQNVEVFLRNYGSLIPKRYSYSDVKKMTYSFKEKLGQGGYGCVYEGKLHDGRIVALKVLNESKGDGEEFVNEVASISRTSHVNIVTLLGFCFESSKRALVYEFMPNGSLEKFIYDENPLRENRQLGWETLYQIAIGIARGLEYLHRGCNTRILHLDIKPHNILLDEDFCPKISDFGLAKLCPKKESFISMLGARGTAGYIAPEVFSRNFGGVSHKSDVYSYGMMVLEMVGGRNNIDVGVDHTSEIYFPHWIYKRLEHGDQLELHGVVNEEENEKAHKMILVGLWCIQTNPSNRPPMGRVVDMLHGSIGSLQIPPKPFLFSPPRSQADSMTSPIMTS